MIKGDGCVVGGAVKLGLAMLAVCVVGLLLAGSVRAQGIGVAPAVVEVADAVRDNEYTRTVTLLNQGDAEITFEVARQGEAGGWVSLHAATDPTATLDKVVVPAKGSTRVLLSVAVPPDAPNGVEDGVISFTTVMTSQEPAGEARVQVNTGVDVQLKVTVSGVQKLSGSVLDVYASDVEVGDPLLIQTKFQNTGNVKAQPEIKLQVKNKAGTVVGEGTYSDKAVGPGQTNTIESQWDTSGKDLGAYVASVAVTLGGNQIHTQEVPFEIVAEGTLRGQGDHQKNTHDNSPEPGGVAEIAAHFENTARTETSASFVFEVYYKDQLLDAVTTPEEPVQPGEVAAIKASVNVVEKGKYTVRGKVTFEGKSTEAKELSFSVPVGGGMPIWAIVVGVTVIALLIVGGGVAWGLLRRLPHPRRPEAKAGKRE